MRTFSDQWGNVSSVALRKRVTRQLRQLQASLDVALGRLKDAEVERDARGMEIAALRGAILARDSVEFSGHHFLVHYDNQRGGVRWKERTDLAATHSPPGGFE